MKVKRVKSKTAPLKSLFREHGWILLAAVIIVGGCSGRSKKPAEVGCPSGQKMGSSGKCEPNSPIGGSAGAPTAGGPETFPPLSSPSGNDPFPESDLPPETGPETIPETDPLAPQGNGSSNPLINAIGGLINGNPGNNNPGSNGLPPGSQQGSNSPPNSNNNGNGGPAPGTAGGGQSASGIASLPGATTLPGEPASAAAGAPSVKLVAYHQNGELQVYAAFSHIDEVTNVTYEYPKGPVAFAPKADANGIMTLERLALTVGLSFKFRAQTCRIQPVSITTTPVVHKPQCTEG